MLLVAVVTGVISVLQNYLSLTVGQRVMNDLRQAVYQHLQRMSLAFFTRTRTGEVQSRIVNDIGGMSQTVTTVATTVVGSVTTVLAGSLVAMTMLDWQLTIVSLLTLPVFVWISRRVGSERRQISMEQQKQLSLITSLLEESLSVNGFMLGRIMGRSAGRRRRVRRRVPGPHGHDRALQHGGPLAAVHRADHHGGDAGADLLRGAGLTAGHGHLRISIGGLVAFTSLQQGLFGPSSSCMQVGIAMQSSLALFERVFEYLDLPLDIAEPAAPGAAGEPARARPVRARRILATAANRPCAASTSTCHPAATSPSSGRPARARRRSATCVPRLYDVTGGRVTIDGVDVRDLSFADLAAAVGVVSQEPHLLAHHHRGQPAVRQARARPRRNWSPLMAAAQIHDLVASLPDGYATLVGERGYRFSGGEKQRIAIARTMLRNPPVLILDEATSSLDTQTERAVQRALDTLAAGRTTITIAHRLSTIRDADQIIVLDHGSVVERGPHAALFSAGGRYARMVSSGGPFTAAGGRAQRA